MDPRIEYYFALRDVGDKTHEEAMAHVCQRFGVLPVNLVEMLAEHRALCIAHAALLTGKL